MRPRHRPSASPRPSLRRTLTDRLDRIRDRLVERDGDVAGLFVRAYGLDRLEQLDRGEPVSVTGFEITDHLSANDRAMIDPLSGYVLHEDSTVS